mgnify:CR=1 FL=1
MGRIVIPRYQRQRAQLKQRPKGSGYFANGFGPQEMSLISKLTDLAVAGGGQIARAVQIGNREEEQAKAQAEYDQRLQTNAEERRAAAQGLVDATDIDFGVEEFFAERDKDLPYSLGSEGVARAHLANLPSALRADMPSQPDLVQPRPVQGGALSPGVLARPGVLAPEDLRPPAQPVSRYAPSWPEQNRPLAISGVDQQLPPQSRPALGEVFGPSAAPALTMEGVLAEAAKAGFDPSKPINPLVREALARASGTMREVPSVPTANLQFQRTFSAADEYGSMQRRAEREREMQGRDFRQEAIEAIGPAPEVKPFRISDILAQASSARTAEQRAMLLQAAADSPDIQASNLSDLAKGAYRDRAMQAVMKLFPEEEEALSEYELLRMQSMRESIETSNLRQQTLQAALDEEAAKAEKRANAVRRTDPRLAKKEALFAFYTANWPRKESGEMTEADWAAGAGELTKMTPSGLGAWTRNNKLSRATRKSANETAGRLLQMRPKPDPQPKVPKVLKPPIASGLRKDLVQAKAEFREIVDEINDPDTSTKKRDELQRELIRANQRRRDIEAQLRIISPKAVSGSGSSPEDPIRL